jgi:flagellar protein FlaG
MDGIKNTDLVFHQQFAAKEYSPISKESVQLGVRHPLQETKAVGDKDKQASTDEQELEKEVKKLNESVELIHKQFKYKIHKDTNRLMIQVIDSETSKVIKEIPPEKILDMVAKIEKMIVLIVDEKI